MPLELPYRSVSCVFAKPGDDDLKAVHFVIDYTTRLHFVIDYMIRLQMAETSDGVLGAES